MQDSNTESSVLLVAPLVPLETVDNDVIECEELQEDILVSMESPTSIVTDSLLPVCGLESTINTCIPETQEPIQPLDFIMTNTTVSVYGGQAKVAQDIRLSIESIDALIHKISALDYESSNIGISPGFDTCDNQGVWRETDAFPVYETLDLVNAISDTNNIPFASPAVALEYFKLIKDNWERRYQWAISSEEAKKNVCSCVGKWEHGTNNVLMSLCNQTIEQLMIREADACLRQVPNMNQVWTDSYGEERCPTPEFMKDFYVRSNVRLLETRDKYIQAYIKTALTAKSTFDLCVCYTFFVDPAARYILLDLVPFLAAQRNIKIRILFELMTLESQCLQMFDVYHQEPKKSNASNVQPAFMEKVPTDAPPFLNATKKFHNTGEFVKEVLTVAAAIPNIECRYWFARDKEMGYRIKNHTKCHIFDGNNKNGKVIAGGSNIVPRTGSLDNDFICSGEITSRYQENFNDMWNAMKSQDLEVSTKVEEEEKKEADVVPEESNSYVEDSTVENDDEIWNGDSKILFIRSSPSSNGEDSILRCVLGGINQAKKNITMCMGHCNIPLCVSKALAAASERGVEVNVLTNSLYSCDLRNGQKDLFQSLQEMLTIAPKVNLFVTAIKGTTKPPFLHSKYVVVDGIWSATGSWNMWTRSAFYEMEAEIFVESEEFAQGLLKKFKDEKELYTIPVKSADECKQFCPKGCNICHQFGPFYLEQ